MNTLTAARPTVKSTVVRFDSARLDRKPLLFGLGVSHLAESDAAQDQHFDRLYLESAMLDRYTRGHVC
jgi:hypothetical protein